MAKKKAPINEPTAPYIANVTIRHNGDRFPKGEEIDLTPTEAAHLLKVGSISPKLVAATPATATPATATPATATPTTATQKTAE